MQKRFWGRFLVLFFFLSGVCLFAAGESIFDAAESGDLELVQKIVKADPKTAKMADPNFDGNLKRSHLRTLESPYNTYKIIGLPPGPIASAGRAALEAVVTPANCKDFFFVSMNNGRHEFCPTIECHNRAVQKWQIDYFRRR